MGQARGEKQDKSPVKATVGQRRKQNKLEWKLTENS